MKFQVSGLAGTRLVTRKGIIVGRTPLLSIPASTTRTEGALLKAEIREAIAAPAEPPPTMMKSYVLRGSAEGSVKSAPCAPAARRRDRDSKPRAEGIVKGKGSLRERKRTTGVESL